MEDCTEGARQNGRQRERKIGKKRNGAAFHDGAQHAMEGRTIAGETNRGFLHEPYAPDHSLERELKAMNSLLAVLIIFFVFFLGDIVATKTKAVVSMLFFGAVVFMIAFWCGLPGTIFKDSGLLAFSSITIGMLLAHIGTTINLRDFKSEWKTVVIVLISTCAIALGVYFIGQHFMDRYYALAGAPVLAGGMVAFTCYERGCGNPVAPRCDRIRHAGPDLPDVRRDADCEHSAEERSAQCAEKLPGRNTPP